MNTTLTAMQVAMILGVSYSHTLWLCRTKRLPAVVRGKAPRFDANSVLAYIKGQQS